MHRSIALLIILSVQFTLAAQPTFTDASLLLPNTGVRSGVAMGIADMNGDFKDDIVRLNIGTGLNIEFQNEPDQLFTNYFFGTISMESEWGLCVGDVDKNGLNDLLVGGEYDDIKLYTMDGTDTTFTESILNNSNIFLQGGNFSDIDNDGWLDIFACHDDGDPIKYRNDQTGLFAFDHTLLPTSMTNGNSGNYASIWTDYDNDGDQDVYISKCRTGVEDPNDARRLNRLFRNNGNHTFQEVASQVGLQIGAQTWCAAFEDIDNDGDMDCFMINHGTPSLLYRNNGNSTFSNITAQSNLNGQFSFTGIQAVMRDFDNDGDIDILVSGTEYKLMLNLGNGSFAPSLPFGSGRIESFAVGDLNHDGYLDVYAGYANIINNPHIFADKLWMNNGGSNNFFVVELNGIYSNKNGIGARIELYYPRGIQIREVRSGEGYGIQNTFNKHFGLSEETTIDSVIVRWPSGITDKIVAPSINQFFRLNEGDLPHCNDQYTLHSTPIPTTTFLAKSLIQTASTISNSGQTVFHCEGAINLLPQFEVEQDAIFDCIIDTCTDPE